MQHSDFKKIVKKYYKIHGRHSLPWRKTKDPYKILISEIMLQQTQVDRVIPKYKSWIKRFPNFKTLANAPLREVLEEWQGLGYNRRAQNLQKAAQVVVTETDGRLPDTFDKLCSLPGIGPYTASAVLAFAFNSPTRAIETNIRQVYIHHFYTNKKSISDKEILNLVEETLDRKNPREWYWALMDYGSYLKKEFGNLNNKSKHYTKQSRFKGSNRELRSKVLKLVLKHKKISLKKILEETQIEKEKAQSVIHELLKEDLIKKDKSSYTI